MQTEQKVYYFHKKDWEQVKRNLEENYRVGTVVQVIDMLVQNSSQQHYAVRIYHRRLKGFIRGNIKEEVYERYFRHCGLKCEPYPLDEQSKR